MQARIVNCAIVNVLFRPCHEVILVEQDLRPCTTGHGADRDEIAITTAEEGFGESRQACRLCDAASGD